MSGYIQIGSRKFSVDNPVVSGNRRIYTELYSDAHYWKPAIFFTDDEVVCGTYFQGIFIQLPLPKSFFKCIKTFDQLQIGDTFRWNGTMNNSSDGLHVAMKVSPDKYIYLAFENSGIDMTGYCFGVAKGFSYVLVRDVNKYKPNLTLNEGH